MGGVVVSSTAMRRWIAVLALGVVSCGASVTRVRGPDGSDDWLVITCHGSNADCYQAAGEECPDGYQVADHHAWNAGSVSFGTQHGMVQGTATRSGNVANYEGTYSGTSNETTVNAHKNEIIIKCGRDYSSHTSPAVEREERQEAAAADPGKDYSTCNAAFAHIDDLATLWAGWFGGTPLDSPGGDGAAAQASARGNWNRACIALDDEAQLCMGVAYARGHSAACKAKLDAAPRSTRTKIGRLLMQ